MESHITLYVFHIGVIKYTFRTQSSKVMGKSSKLIGKSYNYLLCISYRRHQKISSATSKTQSRRTARKGRFRESESCSNDGSQAKVLSLHFIIAGARRRSYKARHTKNDLRSPGKTSEAQLMRQVRATRHCFYPAWLARCAKALICALQAKRARLN